MSRGLAAVCLFLGLFLGLGAAACGFDVHLGAADGVAAVRYEETLMGLPGDLAKVPDGSRQVTGSRGDVMSLTVVTVAGGARQVTIGRDLVVYNDAQAARELDHFGPDQIGALRGVTLDVVQTDFVGLDLGRAAPPTVRIGTSVLAPGDSSVDLDGDTVQAIRVALLTPKAVVVPMQLIFSIPASAPDALGPELHLLLVFQPILTVDATRAL